MAIAQWQSNDVLSTYDKTTGQVKTGYVNLQLPSERELKGGFEYIGKQLAKLFTVLSPTEALRIKHNLGRSAQMTARTSVLKNEGIQGEYWNIVVERWKVQSVKEFGVRKAQRSMMFFGNVDLMPDIQQKAVEQIQQQAEREVQDCDTILATWLSRLCRQVIKDEDNRMPLEMKRRYRTSSIGPGSASEPNPQVVITGSTELNGVVVDPNVFSRFGDGTQADPVMDFITSVFCRVMVNPDTGTLNSVLNSRWFTNIEFQQTAGFYPYVNTGTIPSNYAKNAGLSNTIKNTLAVARKIAVSDLNIMQSFGTGEALGVIFKKSSPMIKLAIVSAFYPWTHSSANPIGEYKHGEIVSFSSNAAGADRVVSAPHIVRTFFLMDMQNQGQLLMRHTSEYLNWIKDKCATAAARRGVPAFARTSPTVESIQSLLPGLTGSSLRTRAASSLARQVPLVMTTDRQIKMPSEPMITGPIILPGFGSGSISTGVGDTEIATAPAESAPMELTTQEQITEPETTEPETTEPETTKSAESSNKMIYIGSAIALTVAIGTVVYVRSRK